MYTSTYEAPKHCQPSIANQGWHQHQTSNHLSRKYQNERTTTQILNGWQFRQEGNLGLPLGGLFWSSLFRFFFGGSRTVQKCCLQQKTRTVRIGSRRIMYRVEGCYYRSPVGVGCNQYSLKAPRTKKLLRWIKKVLKLKSTEDENMSTYSTRSPNIPRQDGRILQMGCKTVCAMEPSLSSPNFWQSLRHILAARLEESLSSLSP